MADAERSLEGWAPEPGGVSLSRIIDLAFDYRGNTTVIKRDGSRVDGYVFNRNAHTAEPFIQLFDGAGAGPFTIPYSEIVTIEFSGKDTAAGNSYAAWLRRKSAERGQPTAAETTRRRRVLVLTALEREARELARQLGLARVPSTPWSHFVTPTFRRRSHLGAVSRPRTGGPGPKSPEPEARPSALGSTGSGLEVMPVGLGAGLLASRWDSAGPQPDIVVSAGLCGALAPMAAAGALLVPLCVLDAGGTAFPVDAPAHADALAAARQAGYPVRTDPLVTVPEIVATPEAKALLRRDSGAAGVDLESAAILRAARARGIPAVVIRGVSDTARQSLPAQLTRGVDISGRLRLAVAAALAVRPWLIPDALALHRSSRMALERVARVLRHLGCPTR